MSEAAVEVVRRSCEAAARGDLEGAMAVLDSDVEVVDKDIPDAGDYRGRDGYVRWLTQWSESWGSWSLADFEYKTGPDGRVVVLFDLHTTGKGSGVELMRKDAMVCTVRDGKVTHIVYFNDQAQALAEAGLG